MAHNLSLREVIQDNIDNDEILFQIEHLINTITEDTRFKIHDAAKNLQDIPQPYYDINNKSYDDQVKLIEPIVIDQIRKAINPKEI